MRPKRPTPRCARFITSRVRVRVRVRVRGRVRARIRVRVSAVHHLES